MSDSHHLQAHLFVCTNKKESGESCAARGSLELREVVKKACQDESKGWHGKVRVNSSGCLGRCKDGITAVMYPKGEWFGKLKATDSAILLEAIDRELTKTNLAK